MPYNSQAAADRHIYDIEHGYRKSHMNFFLNGLTRDTERPFEVKLKVMHIYMACGRKRDADMQIFKHYQT